MSCGNLTNVTMGNSVTDIGDYAFKYCGGLTSVAIPDGVITIGSGAFANCALSTVYVGSSVTTIGTMHSIAAAASRTSPFPTVSSRLAMRRFILATP